MSLISDALNKAQRERTEPFTASVARSHAGRPRGHLRPVHVKSFSFVWINVGVLGAMVLGGLIYLRSHAERAPAADARADVAPASRAIPADAEAPSAVAAPVSPFAAAAPIVAPSAPHPDYELAGMSTMGKTILLSILRRSDKRSVWVPVGKTVGDITALSYDATTDRATISVNGRPVTLALRDIGSAPAPDAQPAE